jgi:hypothetical protein
MATHLIASHQYIMLNALFQVLALLGLRTLSIFLIEKELGSKLGHTLSCHQVV